MKRLSRVAKFLGLRRDAPRPADPQPDLSGVSLTVAPDVRVSIHDDGLALLHIASGRVYLGNQTAARMWKGLMAGKSADTVIEEISSEGGVSREQVRRHMVTFLIQLERRGLVIRKQD